LVENRAGEIDLGRGDVPVIASQKLAPALSRQYRLPAFDRENAFWARAVAMMLYEAEKAKIQVCRTRRESD
jgi:hypothetical protein